jgi:tetratricopeptide (TPR) repeat protein
VALAIWEKVRGPSHPDVAQTLSNLASVYELQGKYAEAAELLQRALAIEEKALGPSNPAVADALSNLANVKYSEGVAALQRRALSIREKALGPSHPYVAISLNNLGNAYLAEGKYAEAAELFQRALTIKERTLGPSHSNLASSLDNLAIVYHHQGKYAEAADLYRRALTIEEKTVGPKHPLVATSLTHLGRVYRSQGKYAEAAELVQRALVIEAHGLGPNHPQVALSLNDLAVTYQMAGKPDLALASSRKATAAVIAHALTGDNGSQRSDTAGGLIAQRSDYFVLHVANLAAAGRAGLYPALDMGREGFEIGQWAEQSSAGAAVQQMALRFSSGDSAVAKLVREQQDLSAAWRGQDKAKSLGTSPRVRPAAGLSKKPSLRCSDNPKEQRSPSAIKGRSSSAVILFMLSPRPPFT